MLWQKFDPAASIALRPERQAAGAFSRTAEGHAASPGALILGGDHGALGIARSLGRRGIPVWFLTDDKINARFSRYTRRGFSWNGPEAPQASEFLAEFGRRNGLQGWVLFPGGDREVKLVSQHHAVLSQVFRLITPPWETTRIAADKHAMYARAAELGIACPRSYAPRTRMQVEQLDCQYPLILKPAEKNGFTALARDKAWRINGPGELLARYDDAVAQAGAENIVLQEMIPGGGDTQFSYTGVWSGGRPAGEMIARRTRQYPVEFGTGTFVEAVEQEAVAQAARKFLASLDYSGLIEIEFKYDARDNGYKILDANPRFWTWNALGALAGVDFGYLQWQLAMGEPVVPQQGRPGAAWIYVSKDIAAALGEMAAGTLTPRAYFRSLRRPLGFAAFVPDDVMPAIVDLPLALWRYLRQRFAGALRLSPR